MWGLRICDSGSLYIRAQDPRRGGTLPRTCNENSNGLEIWPRTILSSAPQHLEGKTILSSAPQHLEGKNGTSSKTAPKALSEERASTVERAREYSVGLVQGKTVTSALNALTNVLATLMGKDP